MKCCFIPDMFCELKSTQKERLEKLIKNIVKNLNVKEFIFCDYGNLNNESFQIIEKLGLNVETYYYTIEDKRKNRPPYTKAERDVGERYYHRMTTKYHYNWAPFCYFDEIVKINIKEKGVKTRLKLIYKTISLCDICVLLFEHKVIEKRAGVTAHAYDYALKKKKIVFNIAYKL